MTEEPRRVHGARGIGALLAPVARAALRKRGALAARLAADWASIVGPELAAQTAPRRFANGRLAIACAGPVAMELQHLAPQLIARINVHLGQAMVTELRLTQDFSPAPPAPVPARPHLPATARAVVQARLAGLDEGPLRQALAALGESLHSVHPPQQSPSTAPASDD